MSKYTTEQLQEMALHVQSLRWSPRYAVIVGTLAADFGLTLEAVEVRIDLLAAGLPVTH